jgi:hypothetical protein
LIGRCIYESSYYEPDTVHLIEQLLDEEDLFFDVSAYVGQYTLVASRRIGPRPCPPLRARPSDLCVARGKHARVNESAVAADHGSNRLSKGQERGV